MAKDKDQKHDAKPRQQQGDKGAPQQKQAQQAKPQSKKEAPKKDAAPAKPAAPEEPAPPRSFDPARILDEEGVSLPEEVVGALLDAYLPGGVRPETRPKLVAFVADGRPSGRALARRVREAVHAIMSMSEYQLA